MNILYYVDYINKKNNKKYANLKNQLDKIEQSLKEKDKIEDGFFYQNISKYKKIKRFADKLGGYRLAMFIYEEHFLF